MKTKIKLCLLPSAVCLLFLAVPALAQPTNVNVGAYPNDGTGDTARAAFTKINNNFAWVYNTLVNFFTTNNPSGGGTFSGNANQATNDMNGNPITTTYVHSLSGSDTGSIGMDVSGNGFVPSLLYLRTTFLSRGGGWTNFVDSASTLWFSNSIYGGALGFSTNGGLVFNGSGPLTVDNLLVVSNLVIAPAVPASGHTNVVVVNLNGGTTNIGGVDITSLGSGAVNPLTPSSGFSNRLALAISSLNTADAFNQRMEMIFTTNATDPNYLNLAAMQSNGNDLRLFDSDGVTPISFWLKSITTSNATVDFVIPSLPHDVAKTIYLDSVNPGAASASAASNVLMRLPSNTNATVLNYYFDEGSGALVFNHGLSPTSATLMISNAPGINAGFSWMSDGTGTGPNNSATAGFWGTYLRLTNGSMCVSTNQCYVTSAMMSFTAGIRLRFLNFPANNNQLWTQPFNGFSTYFAMAYLTGNKIRFYWPDAIGGIASVMTTTSLNTNTWYDVVATVGPDGARIWINGKLESTFPNKLSYGLTQTNASGFKQFVINGDSRGGVSTNNPVFSMDVAGFFAENREWSPDEVAQEWACLGRPVATREKDKWFIGPFADNAIFTARQVEEKNMLFSSYDQQWKMFSEKSQSPTTLTMTGFTAPSRLGPYTPFTVTINPAVPFFSHGTFADDGMGTLYAYGLTTNLDVVLTTSTNGGALFGKTNYIPIQAQLKDYKALPATPSTVTMTEIKKGPFAGQFYLTVETWGTNTVSGRWQIWALMGTNYYGTFNALNNGWPLYSADIYPAGAAHGQFNDPSQLLWFDGRYHMYIMLGSTTTPNTVSRFSSLDLVNWTFEQPVFELNQLSTGRSGDQIADVRSFNDAGGTCFTLMSLMNNTTGQANFPNWPLITTVQCYYNGTEEQLWRDGRVNINGQPVFGAFAKQYNLGKSTPILSAAYGGVTYGTNQTIYPHVDGTGTVTWTTTP